MSYLCEFRFVPLRPLHQDFWEALSWLGTVLRRNGQLLGEPVVGWQGPQVRVLGRVPHPQALDPGHRSEYVQSWLAKLAEWCSETPTCEIYTHEEEPTHIGSLEGAESLYLNPFEDSLLRSSPDGLGVPLYLLPFHPDQRERLNNWQRQFDWVSSLEASGGCLEFETYREMADQHSLLTRQGRKWARYIEAATNLPTYYYLVHHYGNDEATRPCPICGLEWRVQVSGDGLESFPLRCEPCRLISGHASDHTGDIRSQFGQWSLGDLRAPRL